MHDTEININELHDSDEDFSRWYTPDLRYTVTSKPSEAEQKRLRKIGVGPANFYVFRLIGDFAEDDPTDYFDRIKFVGTEFEIEDAEETIAKHRGREIYRQPPRDFLVEAGLVR